MIILMGLKGVGRHTLLYGANNGLQVRGVIDQTLGWKTLRFSDLMVEELRDSRPDMTRDQLRDLPLDEQLRLQTRLMGSIEQMSHRTPKLLLSTHCTIETPQGFQRGIPANLLRMGIVDALIYVTATTEELRARRTGNHVEQIKADALERHEMENRHMLIEYGLELEARAPIYTVANRHGNAQKAVMLIVKIMNAAEKGMDMSKYTW